MSRAAVALAAVLLWAATAGGAYVYGIGVGQDGERAIQAKIEQGILQTREAAQQGAAAAIAQIKITRTTIQGEVRREVETNTVYRDCRLTPDGLRLANEAISGTRTERPGSGELPADPATGK